MPATLAKHLQTQTVHEDDDGSRAATGLPRLTGRLDAPAAGDRPGTGVGDDWFSGIAGGAEDGISVGITVGIAVVLGVSQAQSGTDGADRQDVAERRILRTVRGGSRCGLFAGGQGPHDRPRHRAAARAAICESRPAKVSARARAAAPSTPAATRMTTSSGTDTPVMPWSA